MKSIRIFTFLVFLSIFVFASISCTVQKRNATGKHQPRGWFKNTNNPKHPGTSNPGKNKQKQKKPNRNINTQPNTMLFLQL